MTIDLGALKAKDGLYCPCCGARVVISGHLTSEVRWCYQASCACGLTMEKTDGDPDACLAVLVAALSCRAWPDGWVACAERMPGVGQEVVVVNQNGYVRSCQLRRGWGRNEGKLYWDGHSGVGLGHFTHWQPLPPPPRTDGRKEGKP